MDVIRHLALRTAAPGRLWHDAAIVQVNADGREGRVERDAEEVVQGVKISNQKVGPL